MSDSTSALSALERHPHPQDRGGVSPLNHDQDSCYWIGYFAGAYQKLFHEDFIQIDVTESIMDVTWHYNFYCANDARGVYTSRWFDQSGWRLTHHSSPVIPDVHQRWAQFIGISYFSNNEFCAPPRMDNYTYSKYDPNGIEIRADGSSLFFNYGTAWGACASALEYQIEQRRYVPE